MWTTTVILFALLCNVKGDDSNYNYDTDEINDPFAYRIAGGSPIEITKAPYQVSIERNQDGDFQYWCAASIISKRWIVTTAHCIKGIPKEKFRIRAGSSSLASGGTMHYVERYITHENYNRGGKDYDIAVMKMSEPFQFSDKVKAVPLATEEPVPGQKVWVSGWGRTSYDSDLSSQLNVVALKILSRESCNATYEGEVSTRMLCTLDSEGGKDTCQGESGGGMVTNNKLAGIISWGRRCAEDPSVYTNLKVFKGWIEKSIEEPGQAIASQDKEHSGSPDVAETDAAEPEKDKTKKDKPVEADLEKDNTIKDKIKQAKPVEADVEKDKTTKDKPGQVQSEKDKTRKEEPGAQARPGPPRQTRPPPDPAETPSDRAGTPSDRAGPAPSRLETLPGRAGPPPNRLETPPGRAGPPPNRLGPPPNRLATPPSRFETLPGRAGPPPNRLGPPPVRAGPPPNRLGPPPNRLGPPPSRLETPSGRAGTPPSRFETLPDLARRPSGLVERPLFRAGPPRG